MFNSRFFCDLTENNVQFIQFLDFIYAIKVRLSKILKAYNLYEKKFYINLILLL